MPMSNAAREAWLTPSRTLGVPSRVLRVCRLCGAVMPAGTSVTVYFVPAEQSDPSSPSALRSLVFAYAHAGGRCP